MSESQPQTSHDFWPADLAIIDATVTPVSILREQAAILGQKTQGLVGGEVVSMPLSGSERFSPSMKAPDCEFKSIFLLIVPALDNYRYTLLEICYPIDNYPLLLKFTPTGQEEVIQSQQQFCDELGRLLACEKTISVIRSLIAQARS